LAYPNGLLDLHIETFGRTPWPGDQPDARPLPTQNNTTQKHADTHPCPKLDSNLRSQCSSGRRQYMPILMLDYKYTLSKCDIKNTRFVALLSLFNGKVAFMSSTRKFVYSPCFTFSSSFPIDHLFWAPVVPTLCLYALITAMCYILHTA
jgi:hypothetical protein